MSDTIEIQALFQPSWGAFLLFIVLFSIRYAIFYGGTFFILYVWENRWLGLRKIQQAQPEPALIRYELLWSACNTLCLGLFNMLLYWMIQTGHTRVYFDVTEYGWGWLALSIPVTLLAYDAWFYWQHRLLHTPWFWRNVHSVHHRISNPTPFTTFAKHPIETFTEAGFFLILVAVMPIHPYAMAVIGLHLFFMGLVGHMGFEFFPAGFTRHTLLGWHNTSTHHNMHHSRMHCNYALYFTWWDRWMGTLHPDYDDYFDSVKNRASAGSADQSPSLPA